MKNWVAFLNGQCNKVYYLFKHLLSLLFVILLGKEFNHSSVLSTVSSKSKMVVVKIVERNSKFFRLLFRSHFSSYKHTYSVPYLKFIKKNHFNFFIAVYRFNVYSFRFQCSLTRLCTCCIYNFISDMWIKCLAKTKIEKAVSRFDFQIVNIACACLWERKCVFSDSAWHNIRTAPKMPTKKTIVVACTVYDYIIYTILYRIFY